MADTTTTLYVQNLDTHVDRQVAKHVLYMLFLTYCDVIDIVVQRGYAHVTVPSATAPVAIRCVAGEQVLGRPIKVQEATSTSKRVERMT